MNTHFTFQLTKDSITRYYKQATHELLLSSSCHSVLFRGYVNKELRLTNPLLGYNSQAETYYDRISQSLGVRLQVHVFSPSLGLQIADFLNELDTCQGSVQDMIDFIQTLITETTPKSHVDTMNLYIYSFHFILTKLQEIEMLFKRAFLDEDLFNIDLDGFPTQELPDDYYN